MLLTHLGYVISSSQGEDEVEFQECIIMYTRGIETPNKETDISLEMWFKNKSPPDGAVGKGEVNEWLRHMRACRVVVD